MPLYRLTYVNGTNDLVSAENVDGLDAATRNAHQPGIGHRIEHRVLPHFAPGTEVTGTLALTPRRPVVGTVVTGVPRSDGSYEVMGRYKDLSETTPPSRFLLDANTVRAV